MIGVPAAVQKTGPPSSTALSPIIGGLARHLDAGAR